MYLIYKEILHVLRDGRMMLVVILIPVVQMLLFGFAISTEVNNVDVKVSYRKYTPEVRQAIRDLEMNPYITLKGAVDPGRIHESMRRGEADAVVAFDDRNEVQVIADASNPNVAQAAIMYIRSIVAPPPAQTTSLINTRYLYNPQLLSAYNFAPAIMGLVFLLVCAMMTAVSIVREKERGTMEVLLVSPIRPLRLVLAKMVPFLLLSSFDLVLILAIAKYLLGVPLASGVLPVVLVTVLYIILSLALGLLVSTIAKTQVVAMLISGMVMIFPVIMLSGMIFPVDNLPVVLSQISYIVPARWYIDAMRGLMVMGLDLKDIWREIAILLAMTLVLVLVSLRKFNDRLE